jgi:hypothetical protein
MLVEGMGVGTSDPPSSLKPQSVEYYKNRKSDKYNRPIEHFKKK